MAIPTFFAAGAGGDATGGAPDPPYPAGVAAGDIAICHAGVRQTGAVTFGFPGDWTKVREDAITGLDSSWAWKRLDGTETGTISITGLPGGGIGSYARIYVFRGCIASGTPYEDPQSTFSNSSLTYSSSAFTTTAADRLGVCLLLISDDDKTPLAGVTGSNVTWAPSVTEFASPAGNDGTLFCQQANIATATSVTAGSETYFGTESWVTYTFALIPAAATSASQFVPPHRAVGGGLW